MLNVLVCDVSLLHRQISQTSMVLTGEEPPVWCPTPHVILVSHGEFKIQMEKVACCNAPIQQALPNRPSAMSANRAAHKK